MNRMFYIFTFVIFFGCHDKVSYKDPNAPIEDRVEDLLSQMTLDEKFAEINSGTDTTKIGPEGIGRFGFMNNNLDAYHAAVDYNLHQRYVIEKTRLGIPAMRSGEGIFAYMGNGSTSFPSPLGMAASFDTTLISAMATALGKEMRTRGITNVLAPVLNLPRDSRWGRTGETYGEDPLLISMMGVAYINAMQEQGMLTMPKHFVANMGLNGQFGDPVFFTQRFLREKYFPAFKAAFTKAGAKSVMMAYNTLDGIPCATNGWLIRDILIDEWGFDGVVHSDGTSLQYIYEDFDMYHSKKELAAAALNAGCNRVSPSSFFQEPLREALKEGMVSEKQINESVRRSLRQKFRVGLFDDPYVNPESAKQVNNSSEHRTLARTIAEKSVVLLKNENNTLPFSKDIKKVAVLGPQADWMLINHYGGWGRHEVTIREGLENALPEVKINYVKGVEMQGTGLPAIDDMYFPGGLKAEYFDNSNLEGGPVYIQEDNQIKFDWKSGAPKGLPGDFYAIRWTGKLKSPVSGEVTFGATIDDGARVFLDDSLVIDEWKGGARRMVKGLVKLEKGRLYDIKVEYFENSNTAYMQLGWDIDLFGHIPDAVKAAREADAVIIAVGMKDDEAEDRASLDLDPQQEKLILEVAKLKKPMAVIIQTPTVITMNEWIDKVPAVLMAWYPGCEGGNAIADILLGNVNPGAKLPITFPKVTGQVPLNYNRYPGMNKAHYINMGDDPQFAFGHGLSYTNFQLEDMSLSQTSINIGEGVEVSVNVINTGKMAGDEVIQLYIHDVRATVVRPVMELKGFQRVSLKPGEEKTVSFMLSPDDFKMYDVDLNYVIEPGEFEVMIGNASNSIDFKTILRIVE